MIRQNKLEEGIKLFDNWLLDRLSRTPVLFPVVLWGGLSIAGIVLGVRGGVAWFHLFWMLPLGFVLWTLAEYSVHRWFFHFSPKSKALQEFMYYVHEHHHQYQERDRILTPPAMSIPLYLFFLGIFYVAVGIPFGVPAMFVILGGFGIGYLNYDYVHFYVHFGRPRNRLGKFLRRCHLYHHFIEPKCWYCISFPWIDYLFGTHQRRTTGVLSSLRKPSASSG